MGRMHLLFSAMSSDMKFPHTPPRRGYGASVGNTLVTGQQETHTGPKTPGPVSYPFEV